jgi:hypothetical protein
MGHKSAAAASSEREQEEKEKFHSFSTSPEKV